MHQRSIRILLRHAATSGGRLPLLEACNFPDDPRKEASVTLPEWWFEIITTFGGLYEPAEAEYRAQKDVGGKDNRALGFAKRRRFFCRGPVVLIGLHGEGHEGARIGDDRVVSFRLHTVIVNTGREISRACPADSGQAKQGLPGALALLTTGGPQALAQELPDHFRFAFVFTPSPQLNVPCLFFC